MDNKKITTTIQKIETLLRELKDELDIETHNTSSKKSQNNKTKKNSKGKGPASALGELLNSDFFNIARTAMEVSKELRKQALTYDLALIRVALMRLVRSGLLKREGEGTSKSPWKYQRSTS